MNNLEVKIVSKSFIEGSSEVDYEILISFQNPVRFVSMKVPKSLFEILKVNKNYTINFQEK